MKNRHLSKTARLISYTWISLPITYLIISGVFLGLNTSGLVKVVLSPWYWFICILAMGSGIGILRIFWFGWYGFLFSNFTFAYQTAVVLTYYSEANFKILLFLSTLVLQTVLIYMLGKEIRVPYFFPRIRWWENDPRYKLSIPLKIKKKDGGEIDAEIMDISMGGCFIKTQFRFALDEVLTLNFFLFEKNLSCPGKVMWKTESSVTHPRGIGVKFDVLDKETTSSIKEATKKLKKLARFYNQMHREKNWQEYLQREKNYQLKNKTNKN